MFNEKKKKKAQLKEIQRSAAVLNWLHMAPEEAVISSCTDLPGLVSHALHRPLDKHGFFESLSKAGLISRRK